VELTLTDTDFTDDFFYFCHIHKGMSGVIVQVDADGEPLQAERTPTVPYEYQTVTPEEAVCGTYNTASYTRDSGSCPPDSFVFCDDGAGTDQTFSDCMWALDCAMQVEMRVDLSADKMAAFVHQMIPHHDNAVNMAKTLLKLGANPDGSLPNDPDGEFLEMIWSIINEQNEQITFMRNWLEEYGHPGEEEVICEHVDPFEP
jgi:uncharacterized protein (DUF305 family)